jgi:hypothetical protein
MRPAGRIFAILAVLTLATLPFSASHAQIVVGVSVRVAPPALPIYVQPPIPGPRYIWIPGYWAWDVDDYYWVPGTWVLGPGDGLLWTPGYWGWNDGLYVWSAGYWGPRVGFYGGINYGCGYTGVGYYGGYWRGGVFMYNRSVTNIGSVHITNVYNKTVIINKSVTNVSYNGGAGGVLHKPTAQEQAAAQDKHIPVTEAQTKHQQAAGSNRALFASVNKGKPAIAATAKPGQFAGAGIVAAKGATALAKTPNTVKSATGQPGAGAGNVGAKGAKTLAKTHNTVKSATGQPGAGAGNVAAKRATAVTRTPNSVKSATGQPGPQLGPQPGPKHVASTKFNGPATTKRFNSANGPSGPPGNRQQRQVTARSVGPPRAGPKPPAGQARKPQPQHPDKPNLR